MEKNLRIIQYYIMDMVLNRGCQWESFKKYRSLGLNSKPIKPEPLEMGSRMGNF